MELLIARAKPAEEPRAFVLEFCGNATRAEDVIVDSAKRWEGAGAEVWAVNFPGYGRSTGSARLAAMPGAALCVYDALRATAGERPIFVTGRSIGTTAALYVAAQRPVAGVVAHSPTPLKTVVLGEFGWWNLWIGAGIVAMQVPDDLDAVENARRCTAPAIFVITERDALVRPEYQRRVFEAYAGKKRIVHLPAADHNTAPTEAEESEIRAAIRSIAGGNRAHP